MSSTKSEYVNKPSLTGSASISFFTVTGEPISEYVEGDTKLTAHTDTGDTSTFIEFC